MSKSPVSAVVLNWNGKHFLKKCLNSLLEQSSPLAEIIVVDNGSSDGSIDYLRINFPFVKVIQTGRNLGSAEGHNVGIRSTEAEFIAILDNDIYLDKNWVKEAMTAMRVSNAGIVGGDIHSYNSPHNRIFFPNRFFPSIRKPWAILSLISPIGSIVETDVVQSCAMFVNHEVFRKIGNFSNEFFFWNEDVDFCLRAKRNNFRVVFNTRMVAYHKVGGLRGRIRRIRNVVEANFSLARKNYSVLEVPFALLSVGLANVHYFLLKRLSNS